mmetsp:Transcript_9971/g.14888  ORF Transcript_9971/g.14888 Transcript_9971/m.14888 type:complete len:119 (+) Transcript_9971:28-384(+)
MAGLFEKYGGQSFWNRFLDKFYQRNMSNDTLEAFFSGIDVERIKSMNSSLLRAALGNGDEHFFTSIRRVHRNMNVKDAHFQIFYDNFVETLKEFGVSGEDFEDIVEVVSSFREDVVQS